MVDDRTHTAPSAAERAIAFGSYRLFPSQRLLLDGEEPVRLGSRALDILIALVERPGEVVGKAELIARAWPGIHVDESNLKFQIGGLRRTIGDSGRYLATVPGRGYCFVAPIHIEEVSAPAPVARPGPIHNLPVGLTTLIGRDEACERVIRLIARSRLVTIVGTGGVGKTSVALAVAQRLLSDYPEGVWYVDLSLVDAPAAVPNLLASVFGPEISSADPLSSLAINLRSKQLLLLLDNCAHLIETAATLALTLLRGAPGVHILATSRQPLAIEGERVQRLQPLSCPDVANSLTSEKVIEFSAVRLFVERAAENLGDFELSEADAPVVAEICRQLDGIPLAIELAAARVALFGIRGLAARLHDQLDILTRGRRIAAPRHRTIAAMLDWSYGLLDEKERSMFRRLAIFPAGCTLDAVVAVTADPGQPLGTIFEQAGNLVEKSLLVADVAGDRPRLRLLETTRAYARRRLVDEGEFDTTARRHADYCRELFERAESEWEKQPTAEWLVEYSHHIDDVRSALDWAFSASGDLSIGVALTTAAVPLWMHLSLLEECRGRVEQALAVLPAAEAEPDARREMRLHAALGASLLYTKGGVPEMAAAWTKALELAESLNDHEYRMHALWGLWSFQVNGVQYRTALQLAHQFAALADASPDLNDRAVGERMIGMSHHYLGDQQSARAHIETALAETTSRNYQRQTFRLQLDLHVTSRVHLARILWLQGFPDRAIREAERSIEDARTAKHAISLSYSLARAACPIALWIGDLAAAEQYADMLLDHSKRHALPHWELYARGYKGAVAIKRGDVAMGLRLLRSSYEEIGNSGIAATRFMRFAVLYTAEALGRTGQVADGLAALEDTITRAERTAELWQFPELLRFKGELVLLQGAPGSVAAAEDHFRRALDWGRRQGALSWQLRAAFSLARLRGLEESLGDAKELLASVYVLFTEGFDTADLRGARRLLDELG
jgi:predicted ATPase/DNA-binding winged helix-turn-helix (wHTH) protein